MKFKKFTVTFCILFLLGCHNSHQKVQDKINSENPITVYSTDETRMQRPLPIYTKKVIYYSDSLKMDSLSSYIFSNAFQTEYMDSVGSTVLADSEVELPFDLLYDRNQLEILEIAQVEEKDGIISIAIMKVLPKKDLSEYRRTEFLLWAVSNTDNDSLFSFNNDPNYILMPYLDNNSVFNESYRETIYFEETD